MSKVEVTKSSRNDGNTMFGAVLTKIKKWNWTLFLVIICTAEMGAMGNKNIESISSAFLFGLIAGTVLGLPLAILTKDVE